MGRGDYIRLVYLLGSFPNEPGNRPGGASSGFGMDEIRANLLELYPVASCLASCPHLGNLIYCHRPT